MSSCFWSCLLLGKRRDACTLRCTQYRTRTGVVIGLGDDLRTLPGGLTQAEACGVSSPVRREPEGARLIVSGCWGAWCELLGWDNQSAGGGAGKVMWCGSAAAVFKQLCAKSSVWACCCYLGVRRSCAPPWWWRGVLRSPRHALVAMVALLGVAGKSTLLGRSAGEKRKKEQKKKSFCWLFIVVVCV